MKPLCIVEDCGGRRYGRGYCSMHYQRWRKTGNPGPAAAHRARPARICSVSDCPRAHLARGFCQLHYQRWKKDGVAGESSPRKRDRLPECIVSGCWKPVSARDLCHKHYWRLRRFGEPEPDLIDTLPGEEWRSVVGYEGLYSVSSLGRMRRDKRSGSQRLAPIIPGAASGGYRTVALIREGESRQLRVHRLVAEAFLAKPPRAKHQVNHIDFDRMNNRVENLEWVTPAENIRHAVAGGRMNPAASNQPQGAAHPRARLKDRDVRRMRDLRGVLTQRELARLFGVTEGNVARILNRTAWSHVD